MKSMPLSTPDATGYGSGGIGSVVPLTAVGVLAATIAVVGAVAGWQLGWIELIVLACGCAIALVAALPFVIGQTRVDVTRGLSSSRVVVGTPASVVIDVHNPTSTPTRRRTIDDTIGSNVRRLALPRLAADATHRLEYSVPTGSRGVVRVGPAVIARADPLLLMRREVNHSGIDELWVHPRHDPLRALPVGFAKDLEGPTSDTSPVGDVSFHSLRSYEPGDDYRHIHWMSTARLGEPMVRHYVDNRRPYIAVLLDTAESAMGPDEFEVAVEVTASMGVSSFLHREPVAVWTRHGPLVGHSAPGERDELLDQLSLVEQHDVEQPSRRRTSKENRHSELVDVAQTMVRDEAGCSAVAVVTGALDATTILPLVASLRRRHRVIVVRMWPSGAVRTDDVPGAVMLDVDSLDSFVAAWDAMAR